MIRINLLPVRAEKRKETNRKHVSLLVGYFAVIAILIMGVQFALTAKVDDRKARIQRQRATVAELDVKIKEVKGYEAKIKELTDKINIVRGLELKQRGPAKTFLELARLCPDMLWISDMNDKGGKLTIEGSAIDRQTLAEFMMKLEKSAHFTGVRLVVAKQEIVAEKEIHNFKLTTSVVIPKLEKQLEADAGKAG